MLRTSIAGLLGGVLLSSVAVAQPPVATRLGPDSVSGPRGPRVVEVQAREPVRTEISDELAPSSAPAPPSLKQRLAEAEAIVADRQLARLERWTAAAPDPSVYSPSRVLPPASEIRPATAANPVQVFQPGSTFSHVVARALENRRIAELEVAAAAADTERRDSGEQPPTMSLPQVDAELARNAAVLQASQRRLQRLRTMSQATYSQLYQNLGDKLQLEIFAADAQRQALLEQRAELIGQQ